MSKLFKRVVRVTCWRETVPSDPTNFSPQRLPSSVSVGQPAASGNTATPGRTTVYSGTAAGPSTTSIPAARRATDIPNGIEITDLRVQFRVTRALTRNPPQADIYITNLSQATRTNLETKPLIVQLDGGYDDDLRLLFTGDLRFAMTEYKSPDWETLLQLGDGDCHHRWARVNRSWKKGTTYRTVLTACAASFGMQLPAALAKDPLLDTPFNAGHVSFGPARDELTRLLAPFGYYWSTQNGSLVVLRDDQTLPGSAWPIDEDHGMIGTPEFGSPPRSGKPPHVHVNMLLYPEITPGNLVQITSRALAKGGGLFKVQKVEHRGDTHGSHWTTRAEVTPYNANG